MPTRKKTPQKKPAAKAKALPAPVAHPAVLVDLHRNEVIPIPLTLFERIKAWFSDTDNSNLP